ncbi:MAG TPA: phospholipid scramblase-related protein [Candidatus Saccharimonadales bacterium]|nr:phospholipid scramblase-related protein [Candidatus Saccharimonadales bacterium]
MDQDKVDDSLSFDFYLIERATAFGNLSIKDKDNNTLFVTKSGLSGMTIEKQDGTPVGTVHRVILSMTPKFELRRGDKNGSVMAIVNRGMLSNMLSNEMSIEDPEGNTIGKATGNWSGFEFEITDGAGELVAKITKALSGSLLQKLGQLTKGAYAMNVVRSGVIPNLVLLEFLICVELSPVDTQRGNVAMGNPFRGGFGGTGIEM